MIQQKVCSTGRYLQRQLIEGDAAELEAFIKQNPAEICEFIDYNYRRFYTQVKGSCSSEGFQVSFPKGSRYLQKGDTLSYYPHQTTQQPQEMIYNIFGEEQTLRQPQNTISRTKVPPRTTEILKTNASDREAILDGFSSGNRAAFAEVKACCSSSGMRPTDAECSRYGIQQAVKDGGGPSDKTQLTQ